MEPNQAKPGSHAMLAHPRLRRIHARTHASHDSAETQTPSCLGLASILPCFALLCLVLPCLALLCLVLPCFALPCPHTSHHAHLDQADVRALVRAVNGNLRHSLYPRLLPNTTTTNPNTVSPPHQNTTTTQNRTGCGTEAVVCRTALAGAYRRA